MPAGLPPTPWLQPADPAAHFMQAFQSGAQISEANARLQAQANEEALQLQVRQQEQQRQSLMDQQRLEVEKAYRQAQLGLAKQKLDEASQINQMRIQQASQLMQAQGRYRGRYQELIDQGISPDQASIKAALENADMFRGGTGLGAVQRAAQATAPKTLETDDSGRFFRSSPTEPWHAIPGGSEDKVLAHAPALEAFKEIGQIKKDMAGLKGKELEGKQQELAEAQSRVNELYRARGIDVPFPASKGPASPLPRNKKDLVVGKRYLVKGVAYVWDGDKLMPD